MATIKWRRDTAANWASVNPILMEGEMALETDNQNKNVSGQLPSVSGGYLNSKAWNSELTADTGIIYVDNRCSQVTGIQVPVNVTFLCNTAGEIKVHLISQETKAILKTASIQAVVGENVLDISTLSFDEDIYVGIENVTGCVKTVFPADGNTNGYRLVPVEGEEGAYTWSSTSYSFAYVVNFQSLTNSRVKYKQGNGINRYNDLPYIHGQVVSEQGNSKILTMNQKVTTEGLQRAAAIIDIFKYQETI